MFWCWLTSKCQWCKVSKTRFVSPKKTSKNLIHQTWVNHHLARCSSEPEPVAPWIPTGSPRDGGYQWENTVGKCWKYGTILDIIVTSSIPWTSDIYFHLRIFDDQMTKWVFDSEILTDTGDVTKNRSGSGPLSLQYEDTYNIVQFVFTLFKFVWNRRATCDTADMLMSHHSDLISCIAAAEVESSVGGLLVPYEDMVCRGVCYGQWIGFRGKTLTGTHRDFPMKHIEIFPWNT